MKPPLYVESVKSSLIDVLTAIHIVSLEISDNVTESQQKSPFLM